MMIMERQLTLAQKLADAGDTAAVELRLSLVLDAFELASRMGGGIENPAITHAAFLSFLEEAVDAYRANPAGYVTRTAR